MSGVNDTLEYVYGNKRYTFHIERVVYERPDAPCKRIYAGYFDNPPDGLEAHVKYALVWIQGSVAPQIPANREYREVVKYRGNHIREILHQNDNAVRNEERILSNATPEDTACMVVEPLYEKIPQDLSGLTAYERLLMLEQMCCSIIELQEQNVIAHRDIKLSNYVLERENTSFRLRLIDMASVRTNVGQGTWHGGVLLSPENTSPEGLLEGWDINKKTDVYALGGILGEIFGNFNPLSRWVHKFWPNKAAELETCVDRLKAALQEMRNKYGQDTGRWLESEMPDFRWDFRDCPKKIQTGLKELFVSMTQIDPRYRPDVKVVHEKLREILAWLEENGYNARSGFGLKENTGSTRSGSGLKEKTVCSVYLFDTVGLRGNMSNYENACNRAWHRETLKAKDGETVRSYIGFFGRVKPPTEGGRLLPDKRRAHVNIGRSQYDYNAMICAVKSWADEKESGMNLLGYAMGGAREIVSLTGENVNDIHIFMPSMPQDGNIMFFRGENVQKIYREIKKIRPSVQIIVHSYTRLESDDDGEKWYDRWDKLTGRPCTYGYAVDCEPEETADDEYVPPAKIIQGSGGLYIKANGKNVYVGVERK